MLHKVYNNVTQKHVRLINWHLHIDNNNIVSVRCPICGKESFHEIIDDDVYIDINNFDNTIIKNKKIKFMIFMCWECYDNLDDFEYDENFNLDVLCYDKYMNLMGTQSCYY